MKGQRRADAFFEQKIVSLMEDSIEFYGGDALKRMERNGKILGDSLEDLSQGLLSPHDMTRSPSPPLPPPLPPPSLRLPLSFSLFLKFSPSLRDALRSIALRGPHHLSLFRVILSLVNF